MDALQAFLNASTTITEPYEVKRLGITMELSPLAMDELNKMNEQATFGDDIDEVRLSGIVINKACQNVDFADARMLEHYGARDGADCVLKALKAGEVTGALNTVMTASGFEDMNKQIEKAKN